MKELEPEVLKIREVESKQDRYSEEFGQRLLTLNNALEEIRTRGLETETQFKETQRMCWLHDKLILDEKQQKISNHEDIKTQYDKRMLEISTTSDKIEVEIDRVSRYNDTISDKLIDIDKQLHITSQVFEDKMVDFDPMDYGLCTTKKFNEKLSEVHKSILDKLARFRKKVDRFNEDNKILSKYEKSIIVLESHVNDLEMRDRVVDELKEKVQ